MALTVLLGVGLIGLILCGLVVMIAAFYKKAAPDEALVVTRPSPHGSLVAFDAAVVIPMLHRMERVSLREHLVAIERRGDASLRTRDDEQVELTATFHLRIHKTRDDVLRAAQILGAAAASDPEAVRQRFLPRLNHALESVARDLRADAIDRDRSELCDRVTEEVGTDLDGFTLGDLAITGVRVGVGSAYRG